MIKAFLYKTYSISFIGQATRRCLSPFVKTPNLPLKRSTQKKLPFYIAFTIDCEPGYIGKDELPVWARTEPEAYIGYTFGIKNWLNILARHKVKSTFFLSSQGFAAKGKTLEKIINTIKKIKSDNHEIGSHLHPNIDKALQEKVSFKMNYCSSKFYDPKKTEEILLVQRTLFSKYLGEDMNKTIKSFRWGNWGLSTNAIEPLEKAGYEIDSSATPGIAAHIYDDQFCDWRKANSAYPWKISRLNYQNTNYQDSKVLEIPIATFSLFGKYFRADPNTGPFLFLGLRHYYKNSDRSEKPFIFVIITHSSEGTDKYGRETNTVHTMEEVFNETKELPDVRFITIKEAAEIINGKY